MKVCRIWGTGKMGFYSVVNRKLLKSWVTGFVYKVKGMGNQQLGQSIRWQEVIAETEKRESI